MSFDLNHISPSISPEENAQNRAQNEELRRSGDTGDICSQRIIVITVTITQFLILWLMIATTYLTQASCLDFILFMNLVDFSSVLLAFASTFCNEVRLLPKRGLFQSNNNFLPFSL
jgi:hypothetical protein